MVHIKGSYKVARVDDYFVLYKGFHPMLKFATKRNAEQYKRILERLDRSRAKRQLTNVFNNI